MIQNNSLTDLQLGRFQVNRRKDSNLLSKLEAGYSRHRSRWQWRVSGRDETITSAGPSLQRSQPAPLVSLVSSPKHQEDTAVNTHPLPSKTPREAAGICYFNSKNQTNSDAGLSPAVPTVLLYLLQHRRHLPWG